MATRPETTRIDPLERPGVLVVARRWDQLGGRLTAIANARSLAELLGREFRFVWPRGHDSAVNDPRVIFTETFLDSFEIQPAALEGREAVSHKKALAPAAPAQRRSLDSEPGGTFVDVEEIFDVLRGPDESRDRALERFRRSFWTLGFNEPMAELIDFCASWPGERPVAALHVRAGDIVDGEWRHVVAHEKYSPTAYVHHDIQHLSRGGERQVLVVSDNAPYLAWLQDRFASVITTDEIVPRYSRLLPVQQAFADILVLARCELIVGPPSSAFSRLAANLGPGEIVRADTLIRDGDARDVLRAGIDAGRRQPGSWPKLVARDACWCLDVFGDELALDEQLGLARVAVERDPAFAAALARLARVATLAGDWPSARAAAAQALAIVATVDRYDDPLLEALTTDLAATCMAAIRGQVRLPAPGRRPWDRRQEVRLQELQTGLDRCHGLNPFWLSKPEILDGLGFLIACVERLCEAPPSVRRQAARELARTRADETQLHLLRPSGLSEHRVSTTYDPLARNLDHMALLAFDALRAAGLHVDPPRLARSAC